MTKEEIIREFDIQILIQNECVKGYQKLDFNTDAHQRSAIETIKMLEELKFKVEQL